MIFAIWSRPMGRLHIFESYAQLGVDNREIFHYNDLAIGVWRSLVSRLVRVQEASGSNPDTPTKKLPVLFGTGSFLWLYIVNVRTYWSIFRSSARSEGWTVLRVLKLAHPVPNPPGSGLSRRSPGGSWRLGSCLPAIWIPENSRSAIRRCFGGR